MEHVSPCSSLVELRERFAGTVEKVEQTERFTADIHREHNNTKEEVVKLKECVASIRTQIALIVAVATLVANLLFGLVDRCFPKADAASQQKPKVSYNHRR